MNYFTAYFTSYFDVEGTAPVQTNVPYWAPGFWAVGYWPATYWPAISTAAPEQTNVPYWAPGFWAVGYWSPTYWPAASAVAVAQPASAGAGPPRRRRQVVTVDLYATERRDVCRIKCDSTWDDDDEDFELMRAAA